MFERKKYKEFAKQQLKNRWGIPILITLIVTAISGLLSIKNFAAQDLFAQYFSNTITYEEFVEGYISVDTPLSFMIDIQMIRNYLSVWIRRLRGWCARISSRNRCRSICT